MALRILVLFAHPAYQKSRIQRALLDALHGLDNVTVHDLYENYPTHLIDPRREQALLDAHEAIVFQHPFYWYSAPSLVKEWQDLVLEHGYAYGETGTALRGKPTFSALSTGGPRESYRRGGYNHFTVREFLAPFEQTARLCGMTWLAPYVVHGSFQRTDAALAAAAAGYRRVLERLGAGTLPLAAAGQAEYLNDLPGEGSHHAT